MAPTISATVDVETIQLVAGDASPGILVLLLHGHGDLLDPRGILRVMTSKSLSDRSKMPLRERQKTFGKEVPMQSSFCSISVLSGAQWYSP